MLGLLSADGGQVRILALSGALGEAAPKELALANPLRLAIEQDAFVLNDMQAQPDGRMVAGWLRIRGGEERQRIEYELQPFYRELLARGLCSFLRTPVRLRGDMLGGLVF